MADQILDSIPVLRSALVDALNARRDNDVVVRVPLESGRCTRLGIRSVNYDPVSDSIEIVTEKHLDLPDPNPEVTHG